MKNLNLLVSTSRFNETNAKAELWFTLLISGDTYPIISDLEFSGLIAALTNLEPHQVINSIKEILKQDSDFFQYILKIIPINFVAETNVDIIKSIIDNNYRNFIKKQETFMVQLKRRKNELIDHKNFIEKITQNIDNPVDLDNPDKIIRVEVLGNSSGIAFLRNTDILSFKK